MIAVSYIMNVLNGEPFIKYQLDSIYPYAHEIIIVEGAYRKFRHAATTNGRSTDHTIECINAYPDIEKKIKLIVKPGFYDDRLDMCNELLPHVTGDVIWQVDVDEFYYPETHVFIQTVFASDPTLDRVSFCFYDIFANPMYFIEGYRALGLDNVNRVHRFDTGDRWMNQRPPILCDLNQKQKTIRKHLDGYDLIKMGHVMFNGTALFEKQIREKYTYYNIMSKNISEPKRWIFDVWQNFSNKFNVAGFDHSITYLKKNWLDLPRGFKEMWDDVSSGNYPGFFPRETDDIEEYFASRQYPDYEVTAENLIRLFYNTDGLSSLSLKNILHIMRGLLIIDSATRKHSIKYLVYNVLKKVKHLLMNEKRFFCFLSLGMMAAQMCYLYRVFIFLYI